MSSIDINIVLILVVAALNAWTAFMTTRVNRNMQALEKNTNSKMDVLLTSTAKASLAEGTAAGLQQGRSEERK